MKLTSARVTNFKSIEDSGEFSLGSLTCLAGKNESGKTALLHALHRLNPVEGEAEFNPTMEFPRHRRGEFDSSRPAKVVETTWELSPGDVTAIEAAVGPGSLKAREVDISKRFSSSSRTIGLSLEEGKVIAFLAASAKDLGEEAKQRILKTSTVAQLKEMLEGRPERTEAEALLLEKINSWREGSPTLAAIDIVAARMPKFLYFNAYSLLRGRVSVDEYLGKQAADKLDAQDRVFGALLGLAGTSVETIRGANVAEELIAELESVSNSLSDDIFKYWTQNRHLRVEFQYRAALPGDPPPFNKGQVFETRIYNQRHRVSVQFDERSVGFVWFFSFLAWFSQMKSLYGNQLVILLDEPGLNLHAKAQADLLRYIQERLVPTYQVVYTTHSPFMIDTNDLSSVRTVEDAEGPAGELLGTRVGEQTLSTDADTLFPLRAALGYDLTQSLFVGENCLLIEGPSDLLYFQWASTKLKSKSRIGLDPRWTLTPVGGIDKLASFVALFGANGLNLAVVADYQPGQKGKLQRLETSRLLEAGRVFLLHDYTGTDAADVEDLLGHSVYADLVNATYALQGKSKVALALGGRAVDAAKQQFASMKADAPEFDHYLPSLFLLSHPDSLDGNSGIDEALSRFETLFESLNRLLPERLKA